MGPIAFRRQPNPYGCMYYSAAAVCDVPDGWAEEHQTDCSTDRFVIRLWEQGYLLAPFYYDPTRPTDAAFWERISANLSGQDVRLADFHVSIDSPTYDQVQHAVVVRLWLWAGELERVEVVDTSGHDAPQPFDGPAFLRSPYAAARDVRLIWSNALESWLHIDGPSSPHALDPEAYRREIDNPWP